ncbi:MAG TPA: ABC transporter ATP-binding protein [Blastocatellia bacterium]|nr:ABC transporter ATP-binding protein [Blastocatellia bacterium]
MIKLNQVSFCYSTHKIVQNLDLCIERESIMSIMGPSGCGKSTLLRLISGLELPSLGYISFDGEAVSYPPKDLRYSFQDYDAFPWLTVEENVLLSNKSLKRKDALSQTNDILKRVGLYDHRKKYPAQLSGGMRKRLALGRCIAGASKAILLDEPFSSLDVDARNDLHNLVLTLAKQIKCTFLIVTHDIEEAIFLSSKVVIATQLPFQIRAIVEIPFPYPRTEALLLLPEFQIISKRIRGLLIQHSSEMGRILGDRENINDA